MGVFPITRNKKQILSLNSNFLNSRFFNFKFSNSNLLNFKFSESNLLNFKFFDSNLFGSNFPLLTSLKNYPKNNPQTYYTKNYLGYIQNYLKNMAVVV